MTLNITVTTRRGIYQSADYRLIDVTTGTTFDFETQKIVLVNAFKWSATVCFAGVGRTHDLDVGEWLAERVGSIQFNDPFERLIHELQQARDWLSAVPAPNNKHSFSVGAFVGAEAVFALVSNFEQPFGVASTSASPNLSVYEIRPSKPMTFVSGQKHEVSKSVQRGLASLASGDPEPARMYSALADVNRRAAMRNTSISRACFTTHVRLTGEGGGQAHDIGDRLFVPTFAIPSGFQEAVTQVLEERFGPGLYQLRSISTVRADASDEYHETQLREKPEDPNTHSNYGAYLKDKKGDLKRAERSYRKAIELDCNHVNALGNLASLLSEKGCRDQAAALYRAALEADPGNENVTWNYARFLLREFDDRQTTREVLDQGITAHQESGRLLMLRADLSLLDGNALEALEGFRRAREKSSDQAEVEAGYAYALQLSGASTGECIGAYRVAIGLNPENAALRLNLAQLMFIKGDMEANLHLEAAMRLQLDEPAQLEAQFYLLCHTSTDPAVIFRTTKSLLARGARLCWDVRPNIETVVQQDPEKAALLEIVSKVMTGERGQVSIDQVIAQWPQKSAR